MMENKTQPNGIKKFLENEQDELSELTQKLEKLRKGEDLLKLATTKTKSLIEDPELLLSFIALCSNNKSKGKLRKVSNLKFVRKSVAQTCEVFDHPKYKGINVYILLRYLGCQRIQSMKDIPTLKSLFTCLLSLETKFISQDRYLLSLLLKICKKFPKGLEELKPQIASFCIDMLMCYFSLLPCCYFYANQEFLNNYSSILKLIIIFKEEISEVIPQKKETQTELYETLSELLIVSMFLGSSTGDSIFSSRKTVVQELLESKSITIRSERLNQKDFERKENDEEFSPGSGFSTSDSHSEILGRKSTKNTFLSIRQSCPQILLQLLNKRRDLSQNNKILYRLLPGLGQNYFKTFVDIFSNIEIEGIGRIVSKEKREEQLLIIKQTKPKNEFSIDSGALKVFLQAKDKPCENDKENKKALLETSFNKIKKLKTRIMSYLRNQDNLSVFSLFLSEKDSIVRSNLAELVLFCLKSSSVIRWVSRNGHVLCTYVRGVLWILTLESFFTKELILDILPTGLEKSEVVNLDSQLSKILFKNVAISLLRREEAPKKQEKQALNLVISLLNSEEVKRCEKLQKELRTISLCRICNPKDEEMITYYLRIIHDQISINHAIYSDDINLILTQLEKFFEEGSEQICEGVSFLFSNLVSNYGKNYFYFRDLQK